MRKGATWAITGASGYVGRALSEHLSRNGVRTKRLVRRRIEDPARSSDTFVGDVMLHDTLAPFLEGADVVVHLAAYVHRATSKGFQKSECRAANVTGTSNLIRAMRLACPDAFLVFTSSINVYRETSSLLTESSPTEPRTYYGETKLEAERLVLEAVERKEIEAAVLRPAAVIGPGAPGNLQSLIRLAHRGLIVQIGRADNLKSLLPIETLVSAIVAVAESRERSCGEVFNVAGSGPIPMSAILDVIADHVPQSRRIVLPRLPFQAFVAASTPIANRLPSRIEALSHALRSYLSTSAVDDRKLRSLTGQGSVVDSVEALRRTLREAAIQ